MIAESFLSQQVISWAAGAGFVHSLIESGTTSLLYNRGGEDRYYLRRAGDFIRITSASRAGEEEYEVDASSSRAADAYFLMKFGPVVRSTKGLDRLKLPIAKDSVAPPFTFDERDATALRLLGADHNPAMIVAAPWDAASDVAQLVRSSWALAYTASEVCDSFLARDGGPLFSMDS